MSYWFNVKIYLSATIIIFCILGFSLDAHAISREEAISQTLDSQEQPNIENIGSGIYSSPTFPTLERGYVIDKTLGKIELASAIGIGYLGGNTSYEINFVESGIQGKSKLVFPFDNWLAGGNISAGYYPFYLNFQGWTNIGIKRNGSLTDQDWADGDLFSSTESENEAQIAILDASLLYNFWQGDKPWGDVSRKFKQGRFGLLLGYRYEKFKYDILGVRDLFSDITYYAGQKVSDYKVQYQFPYFGVNFQYVSDVVDKVLDRWGLNVQVCGSPYVTAKDRDDHILRNKLIEGNTKGYAFLMGLNAFFKTKTHWMWRLGLDYTDITTRGKQRQYWYGDDPASEGYDDTGDSIEGINLKIGSSQYLFWSFLQYNF